MCSRIEFVELQSEVPIVRFTLDDGTEGFAIIDTGSESTMFDNEFVRKNKKQFKINKARKMMTFIGINTSSDYPVINVDVALHFDTAKGVHDMSVNNAMLFPLNNISESIHQQYDVEIPISAILGSDLLCRLKAKIDFKDNVLIVNDDISGK